MRKKKTRITRKGVSNVLKGDTGFVLDAITKVFKDEAQSLREEADKRRQEEKQKIEEMVAEAERATNIDYNRGAYFERNIYGATQKLKAYYITFDNHPEYTYVAFALTNEKAKAEAQRYIRDTYYPLSTIDACPVSLKEARSKRMPEFDEFKHSGKIPINRFLKEGFKVKCCVCGKFEFDYNDYMAKRCFIVEGEGDLTPYLNGYLFCYSCYHKYF